MRRIPTLLLGVLGLATGCATIYLGGLFILELLTFLFPLGLAIPPLAGIIVTALCIKKAQHAQDERIKRRYKVFAVTYAVGIVLTIAWWLYLISLIEPLARHGSSF